MVRNLLKTAALLVATLSLVNACTQLGPGYQRLQPELEVTTGTFANKQYSTFAVEKTMPMSSKELCAAYCLIPVSWPFVTGDMDAANGLSSVYWSNAAPGFRPRIFQSCKSA